MKRYIGILLVFTMVFLAGCSLLGQDTSDKASSAASSTAGGTAPGGLQNGNAFEDNANQTGSNSRNGNQGQNGNTGGDSNAGGNLSAGLNGTAGQAGNTASEQTGGQTTAVAGTSTDNGAASSVSINKSATGTSEDCTAAAGSAKLPVAVYYQDGDGYLVPMTRWIDKQLGIARAAVSALIDSAIAREEIQYYGVYPVLPENTEILGINVKDGLAVIDFSPELLNYPDKTAERNIIASVIYTLTQFDTIDSVRILVNGYPQEMLKYGTDISGVLSRENVMINTQEALNSDVRKADIYCFVKANEGFTYLLPVSFPVTGEDDTQNITGSDSPDTLVRLLLSSKPKEPLWSEIPAKAALIGATSLDGSLTLDFDAGFIDYGGNAREEGILKQLLYTVRQAGGINKVELFIGGRRTELPEGTDISNGLSVPKTINDYIDR